MDKLRKYITYHRNIYVILVSWILLTYVTYGIDPYIPNYIAVLGGSEADIGWIYGIVNLISIPLLLIGGVLGDYIGRRRLIVSITFAVVLTYLTYYFAINPFYILMGMMISTTTSLYRPSLMALVGDSLKPGQRGRGIIFIRTIPDLLSVPAPFIIGYIIALYGENSLRGYREAFLIGIALALSAFIVRLLFLSETLKQSVRKKLVDGLKDSLSVFKLWDIVPKPMKKLIKLRAVTHLAIGLYARYLIRYATVNGVSADLWGSIYSIATAAGVLVSFSLLPYVDAIEHRAGMTLGFIMRGLGLILFIYGSIPGMVLGLPMIFMGRDMLVPFARRYQIDSTPHEVRARVSSLDLIFRNIFLSAGLFLASIILSFTGQNLLIPLFLGMILTFISGILFITYLPKLTEIEE